MYGLLHEAFPWLVALYLVDALVYVRRRQVAVARVARRFGLRGPGIHLVGLLPVSEVILTEELPLLLGPDGVYRPRPGRERAAIPDPDDLEWIPYEEVRDCRVEDRTVLVPGRRLAEAASRAGAQRLAEALQRMVGAEPRQRAQELRAVLVAEHSGEGVRALRARQARFGAALQGLGWVLGLGFFAALPLGVYANEWGLVDLRVLGAVLAVAYVAVMVTGARALRHCGMHGRLATLAGLIFFPPGAAHAASVIFRDLYRSFAPLAVAAEFLEPDAFRRGAGRELHVLEQAASRSAGGLKEAWLARRQAILGLLAERGASPSELEASIRPDDAEARAYCPLCGAGYREGFTSCSDCGTALLAIEP